MADPKHIGECLDDYMARAGLPRVSGVPEALDALAALTLRPEPDPFCSLCALPLAECLCDPGLRPTLRPCPPFAPQSVLCAECGCDRAEPCEHACEACRVWWAYFDSLAGCPATADQRREKPRLGRSPELFPVLASPERNRVVFNNSFGDIECECIHLGRTHRWTGGRLVCTIPGCGCTDYHPADGERLSTIPPVGEK